MKHLTLTTAMAILLASPVLANDTPGAGVTVRPVIQPLMEEMFQSRVLMRALGDLGYTVAEPQEPRPPIWPWAQGTQISSLRAGTPCTTLSSRNLVATP
ncbi:hypothetical protein ACFP8Z_21565 [Gemmobacter lanyuensis]|uniref:hypothetical protein n=1 Tax=Gemmobacter lanyuensis TaxID=1054497 RepID=UPI00361AA18D